LAALKKKLRSGLSQLPTAQHEYQIVMPELPTEPEEPEKKLNVEEDAEDALRRLQDDEKLREVAAMNRRSQAINRKLPRPTTINLAMNSGINEDPVKQEVADEMLKLLKFDSAKYPIPNAKNKKQPKFPLIDDFSDLELQKARELVYNETLILEKEQKEAEKESKMTDVTDGATLLKIPPHVQSTLWETLEDDIVFLPNQKTYGLLSTAPPEAQLQAWQQQFGLLREHLIKESKKAQKLENVIHILVGGYQERAKSLLQSIDGAISQYEENLSDLDCFEMLAKYESVAIPNRIYDLRGQVEVHKAKEAELQTRYASLKAEKEKLATLMVD